MDLRTMGAALRLPEGQMFDGVGVDGLVQTTMHRQVGLLVAGQPERRDRHRPGALAFADGAEMAAPGHQPGLGRAGAYGLHGATSRGHHAAGHRQAGWGGRRGRNRGRSGWDLHGDRRQSPLHSGKSAARRVPIVAAGGS